MRQGETLVVLLGFVAGCGSNKPDGLGPIEDFVAQLKEATCANDVTCGLMPDMATCLATTFPERNGGLKTLAAAIEAGRARFDAQAGMECITAIRALPCTLTGRLERVDACDAMFTGLIETGQPCVIDSECTSGECDKSALGSCSEGVCAGVAPPGDLCEDELHVTCAEGSYCHFTPEGINVCQSYAGEGETCSFQVNCEPFLLCPFDPVTSVIGGQCFRRAQAGEPCLFYYNTPCEQVDHYCESATGLCTPHRAPGASCARDLQCPPFAVCSQDTCVPKPGDGSCSIDEGGCIGQIQCDDGNCTEPRDGDACSLP